ncbi:MAG: cytochrome c-type biogenesis protein CcmH [Fidelibacterota bacterium]
MSKKKSSPSQDSLSRHTMWLVLLLAGVFIGYLVRTPQQVTEQPVQQQDYFTLTTLEIARQFNCSCGSCGELNLASCTCPTAQSTKKFIEAQINKGQSEEKVVDLVKEVYGHFRG